MTRTTPALSPDRSWRLWPGVLAACVLLLVRFGSSLVIPGFEGFRVALFGSFIGVLAVVIWWLGFSRAPWVDRCFGLALIVLIPIAMRQLNHESMGLMWGVSFAVQLQAVALVAWAVASQRFTARARRTSLVLTLLLACAVWTMFRLEGLSGNHDFQFAWRWSASSEEHVLQKPAATPLETSAEDSALMPDAKQSAWPGFRGPRRDGVVQGLRIATDWSQTPPTELWRRSVGPGWSSFAVKGDRLYTQEQRGEEEIVSCHRLSTGAPLWRHRDPTRFYEAMGGAGPRATPTVDGDQVYALGATGILNAFAADDGEPLWSRNVAEDTASRVPIWGFASSPLVIDDVVVVAAMGALVGYDRGTGSLRWHGSSGGESYSSPQAVTIDGVVQVVLLNRSGVTSVTPFNGETLWEYPWSGVAIVQPGVAANGDLLISAGEGKGLRRIAISRGDSGWSVEQRWESNQLKPNFNDFVIHRGYGFGFDGSRLACIDLRNGTRAWKGDRYGHGQLLLLPAQELLLVLSESGELAVVQATPEHYNELARFPAIEGKTWNHPAVVGELLLVRNSEQMAAFRLPVR